MFSITSGESSPRVKFRGLGKAAGNRSPGSSPQIEHRVVKIANHFGLPSTRFPPLGRLGKEGGVPASLWIFNPQWECKGTVQQSHLLKVLQDSNCEAELHQTSTTGRPVFFFFLSFCVIHAPDDQQQNKDARNPNPLGSYKILCKPKQFGFISKSVFVLIFWRLNGASSDIVQRATSEIE